jgi:hypothetical protein
MAMRGIDCHFRYSGSDHLLFFYTAGVAETGMTVAVQQISVMTVWTLKSVIAKIDGIA